MNKNFLLTVIMFIGITCLLQPDLCAQDAQQKIAVINIPQSDVTTMTVGPLVAKRGDQAWLSKAIADLLIKNLSEVQSLVILERERMQAFSDEVGLTDSALFNQEKALRVGRVARVDQVVYGSYELKGGIITVSIFLMDLETQNIVLTDQISGSYDQLRSLMKQLVFRFLQEKQVVLSEVEKKNIQFQVTDSITATEYFYRGVDSYDQGQYPEAFGKFLKASHQDSSYVEALLWVGRMFEAQGFYNHAVIAYQKLYDSYPQSVEGRDALLFAGKVLEFKLEDFKRAVDTYRSLTAIKPVNPHSLYASFRLGHVLQKQGDALEAYHHFQKIDDFRESWNKGSARILKNNQRTSRFVSWREVLALYKESIVSMISVYKNLLNQNQLENIPKPPRGVIVLDADNPVFEENVFDHTPSLFPNEQDRATWRERIYVVIVPKGRRAVGVDFSITGQIQAMNPGYDYTMRILPFPLPRDFDRYWYGVIFGQTREKTTLRKSVSFFGDQLDVFAIQLIENPSKIFDWRLKAKLINESDVDDDTEVVEVVEKEEFWEGKPLAQIPLQGNKLAGATRLLQQAWYQSKKELDILYDPASGYHLVVTQGEIDGEQIDLWYAHSQDGVVWSDLERLDINSSSEEFNPRLLRAEDGRIHLAWNSNRQGNGWELWMSSLNDNKTWASPHRIALEKIAESGMEKRRSSMMYDLLDYDLLQDIRGQWILAYYSYDAHAMVLLKSLDTKDWSHLASVPTKGAYGASLTQDSSGVYRLGFVGHGGKIYLLSSNDAIDWHTRPIKISFWNQSFSPTPTIHRMRLFPLEIGNLLMLISDNQYGLQFARFQADTEDPVLDLVSRVGLQPYGVARMGPNNYLVAIKEDEEIILKQYKKFNVSGKEIKKDTRNWPIYEETEKDAEGHVWTRTFAQERRRVSDVTALGLEANGRLWWGIETGVMYKHGQHFYATDVSLGFFYHFVTDITSCSDERVWFSSHFLNKPELGVIQQRHIKPNGRPRIATVMVPEVRGAITDVTCGLNEDHLYVGTSKGNIVGFNGKDIFWNEILELDDYVTALDYNKKTRDLWVGTKSNGVYQYHNGKLKQHFYLRYGLPSNEVADLVVDQQGTVWVALYGNGLMQYKKGEWYQFTPNNSHVLYWSMNHLAADSKKGIWYLPHDDVRSKGLGFFDGAKFETYNPPHHILPSPSSLVVSPKGTVWVGTWFEGVYQLERKAGTR